MTEPARASLLIVTGLSGAGKSSALKTLEDIGYEAIDNLPLTLLPVLAEGEATRPRAEEAALRPLVVGVDSRTRGFSAAELSATVTALRDRGDIRVELLFLDADDAVLRARFSATRRRHPLALDRPVEDGIALERALLSGLRDLADRTVDTSLMPLPEFRRLILGHYRLDSAPSLTIMVTSFSYRRGLPREADLVFDVRFLDNPFYRPELAPLDGEDRAVGAFIGADPAWSPFFSALNAMLDQLVPLYGREGKQYLTIAVGCTGGRHRSVFTAARLAERLGESGYRVALRHRDREAAGE